MGLVSKNISIWGNIPEATGVNEKVLPWIEKVLSHGESGSLVVGLLMASCLPHWVTVVLLLRRGPLRKIADRDIFRFSRWTFGRSAILYADCLGF